MKVLVDELRCDAHGLCVDVCPEVFALDDTDDLARLLVDAPDESLRASLERAALLCPKAAIRIEDSAPWTPRSRPRCSPTEWRSSTSWSATSSWLTPRVGNRWTRSSPTTPPRRWTPDSLVEGRDNIVGAMRRIIGSDEIVTYHHVATMAPVVNDDTADVSARVRAMHHGVGPRAGQYYESLGIQPTLFGAYGRRYGASSITSG